ncbi:MULTISPECIES: MFS transporter [unclassified Streptomyces]|uniref:MFS transporter n=1 Tax=unclassified Streptomyces TaxID=2593676 RepID=UPI002DD8DD14|nr:MULTISPECIES: MFS transporter [unclassified Streptomyces]WSA96713.1 MFS transporter [Streptomyces sp. NBC_01795]WSB81128.1 MFS transporter [Streptomyces sp. NBC_01775]WSS10663.1 MFS transporter [Streptomyces sp. NBC_01186]WSS39357.1 MFS transporter [Streptomyces sp. NBC_01187]
MGFRGTHDGSGHADARAANQGRGQAAVLWLACVAQFMVVLDVSVVNVALPSIQSALGFGAAGLQWVVGGYALVFAGFLLLGGRLADLYGRRRVFLWGLVLFAASSLIGGLATTPGVLIGMRAVQGLGAAVLAPATLTILTTTFTEGTARTWALAIWTAVSSAGGAAGNLIGGVLTQSLSWRWILLINVPLGVVAVLAALRLLPADRSRASAGKLDLPGAVLATLGVTALVHGVTHAQDHGWSGPTALTGLAVGVLALAAFAVTEARYAAAPLVPPRLVRMRPIWAGNAVMLLAGACFIPMWYFLSLYMQDVLHYGALATGIAFLPHTLVGVVGARLAPAVMRRTGPRALIVLAALLAAAGFVWQSRIGADSTYWEGLLGPAIVMSAGMGLLITPITTTVTSGIAEQDAGAASGLMNATRQIGGAVGLAALVTLAATADSYRAVFLAIAAVCTAVAALAFALPAPHRRDQAAGVPKQ